MPCIRAPPPEGGESGASTERGRARLAVEFEWVKLMQELGIEDASVISNGSHVKLTLYRNSSPQG